MYQQRSALSDSELMRRDPIQLRDLTTAIDLKPTCSGSNLAGTEQHSGVTQPRIPSAHPATGAHQHNRQICLFFRASLL